MTIVGGLRTRLIFDSIYNMINDSMASLGWFDPGRSHEDITFLSKPLEQDQEVALNTMVLTAEDAGSAGVEMGSYYAEHNRTFFVDFYGESHALAEHVIYDVRDILQGRFPSIGRNAPVASVYDYRTQPTPPEIFTVDIDFVTVDRASRFTKPWEKHWWSCAFTVTDAYGNEDDDA